MNYDDYMKSVEWDEKRALRFRMDGFRCYKCGSAVNLQCHHITYERLGNERMSDLITLCARCHKRLQEPEQKPGKKNQREQDDKWLSGLEYLGFEKDKGACFLILLTKLNRLLRMRLVEAIGAGEIPEMVKEDYENLKNILIEWDPVFKEVLTI